MVFLLQRAVYYADCVFCCGEVAVAVPCTKTFYAREAVIEHLNDLEDYYLAEQRLADIHLGNAQAVSLEELMKHYGMDY